MMKILVFALLIAPVILTSGCASVPKESVELSYALGEDLESLHQSYKILITGYFDYLRSDVNSAVDRVFFPAYINDFVKTGELIEHAKNENHALVEAWARIAVETVDRERIDRIEPINQAERELLFSVNEAFDKAVRANSTITAHLNSIRKVDEVQDKFLESLELKDVRDRIHLALAEASNRAKAITQDINESAIRLNNNDSQ
jgi:hypothetical protein